MQGKALCYVNLALRSKILLKLQENNYVSSIDTIHGSPYDWGSMKKIGSNLST